MIEPYSQIKSGKYHSQVFTTEIEVIVSPTGTFKIKYERKMLGMFRMMNGAESEAFIRQFFVRIEDDNV